MSTDLSLMPTDVAADLRATVRGLLADRCPPAAVIGYGDGDRNPTGPLWSAVARELGLAGLLVPEALGGSGAGHREVSVVAAELGAAAAPVPFLESAVLATSVLLEGGSDLAETLLGRLAEGETTAALVVPWTSHSSTWAPAVGDGPVRARSVAGVLDAQVLLVPVDAGGGVEVRAVDRDAEGVEVTPVVSLDMTRQLADVEVDLARAGGEVVVPAPAGDAVRRALRAAASALTAEQAGLARTCLTATCGYLSERHQFGRPLAGFQALKHRLADLWVQAESADAVSTWAAATLDDVGDEDERDLAVATAAAYCADAAVGAAEEQVQLHGGIAMTWEHPAHVLLKRAKADQLALGGPEAHRRDVARLADLPPA